MIKPPQNDKDVVFIIVFSIVFGFLFSMITVTVFAWNGREVPPAIAHLLDVAFGSIATILAQTRTSSDVSHDAKDAVPVTVENPPSQPVPTEETAPEVGGKPIEGD